MTEQDQGSSRSQPCADAQERSPIEWSEVESEAAEAMVKAAMPVVRRAADDLYAELLDSVESFLSENVRFNLSVQLKSAKTDAHDMRMKNLRAGQARGRAVEGAWPNSSNGCGRREVGPRVPRRDPQGSCRPRLHGRPILARPAVHFQVVAGVLR